MAGGSRPSIPPGRFNDRPQSQLLYHQIEKGIRNASSISYILYIRAKTLIVIFLIILVFTRLSRARLGWRGAEHTNRSWHVVGSWGLGSRGCGGKQASLQTCLFYADSSIHGGGWLGLVHQPLVREFASFESHSFRAGLKEQACVPVPES